MTVDAVASLVIGVDVVDVTRFADLLARRGERLLGTVFTEAERAGTDVASLAARFAAKEAVSKALGSGIGGDVRWRSIEVVRGPSGAPAVRLSGGARDRARALGVASWAISLSHTDRDAIAFVIGSCPLPTSSQVIAS